MSMEFWLPKIPVRALHCHAPTPPYLARCLPVQFQQLFVPTNLPRPNTSTPCAMRQAHRFGSATITTTSFGTSDRSSTCVTTSQTILHPGSMTNCIHATHQNGDGYLSWRGMEF